MVITPNMQLTAQDRHLDYHKQQFGILHCPKILQAPSPLGKAKLNKIHRNCYSNLLFTNMHGCSSSHYVGTKTCDFCTKTCHFFKSPFQDHKPKVDSYRCSVNIQNVQVGSSIGRVGDHKHRAGKRHIHTVKVFRLLQPYFGHPVAFLFVHDT